MPIDHPAERSLKDRVVFDIVKDDVEADKVIPRTRRDALDQAVWDTIKADEGMIAATPLQRGAMLYRLGMRLYKRGVVMIVNAADPV